MTSCAWVLYDHIDEFSQGVLTERSRERRRQEEGTKRPDSFLAVVQIPFKCGVPWNSCFSCRSNRALFRFPFIFAPRLIIKLQDASITTNVFRGHNL